jgi:hypothetical protein
MIQTEAGLDKRKEVGLVGLFFWHQLVHYYSALMAHFSTGVDIWLMKKKLDFGSCLIICGIFALPRRRLPFVW